MREFIKRRNHNKQTTPFAKKLAMLDAYDPGPARRSAEDAAAQRKLKRERAAARAEAEREALVKHLEEQDARLKMSKLKKEAIMQKRQLDSFDPTPARRVMYDDKMCADAAEIPGPAQYSPRVRAITESGIIFAGSVLGTGSIPDRDAGSLDSYRVKIASQQPGPASYDPKLSSQRGMGGSTFGLSPELRHGKVAPSAHDMGRMVAHLRDLPSPAAYSPRDPQPANRAFRMMQPVGGRPVSNPKPPQVPGPGTYSLEKGLSSGRSVTVTGRGNCKSELDMVMDLARDLPGPGAYGHKTELRSTGAPRFSKAGQKSMIETIMDEEKKKPGPNAYFPQATFEKELEMLKYKQDIIKGRIKA